MKNKEYGIVLNWNYVIVSIVVVAILTLLVLYMPGIRSFDYTLLRSIRLALSPFPSYIPIFISEFGMSNHMLWPQITACCVLVSHRYYLKAFLVVFFTQAAFFLKDLLKNFVCRERPSGCGLTDFCFPSGHACASMCFYGIVIYLIHHYVRNDFWRNFLIIFFGIWIFFACISRLWLGVHFTTDVVAGAFLGFMLVNLYIILSKTLSS